ERQVSGCAAEINVAQGKQLRLGMNAYVAHKLYALDTLRSRIQRWQARTEQNRRAISELRLRGYGNDSYEVALIRRESRELYSCIAQARMRLHHHSIVASEKES